MEGYPPRLQVHITCQHYEAKCSGRYHDHPASASYLKGLVDDITALLEPLKKEYFEAKRQAERTEVRHLTSVPLGLGPRPPTPSPHRSSSTSGGAASAPAPAWTW
jgi:hypothetical protein